MFLKLKNLFFKILIFIIIFFTIFFYAFLLCSIFCKLEFLSNKQGLIISAVGSIFLSLCISWCIHVALNSNKKSKKLNYIYQNYSKIILFYIVSGIFFGSIRVEGSWTVAEMKDAISIEWTIIGISITIFLVWNVLVLNYLKSKKPNQPNNDNLLEVRKYIDKKGEFYQNASTLFNTISLLTINLIILCIATTSVYISQNLHPVWCENVIILSYYFSTNTVILLFLDILGPLKEDKKNILTEMKVTQKDVELSNQIDDNISKTLITLEKINELDLSQDDKFKIEATLLKELVSGTCLVEKLEDSQEELS